MKSNVDYGNLDYTVGYTTISITTKQARQCTANSLKPSEATNSMNASGMAGLAQFIAPISQSSNVKLLSKSSCRNSQTTLALFATLKPRRASLRISNTHLSCLCSTSGVNPMALISSCDSFLPGALDACLTNR